MHECHPKQQLSLRDKTTENQDRHLHKQLRGGEGGIVHKVTTQISHANLDDPKRQPQTQTELNSEQNTHSSSGLP